MNTEANSVKVKFFLGHHPLIWWILPCLLGVASAFGFPAFFDEKWLLVITTVCSLGLLILAFGWPPRSSHFLWYTGYVIAVFCFSIVFFKKRFLGFVPKIPASREVVVELTVTKILQPCNAYGRTLYIASIEETSGPVVLTGQQVYVSMVETPLVPSARLELFGVIEPIGVEESGFFHYLRTVGVQYRLHHVQSIKLLSSGTWLERKRQQWARGWELILQKSYAFERYAPLYASMLLGNKVLIETELKDRFGLAGCLHLFAVSGLHVGILAGLLLRLFSYIRGGVWAAAPCVFAYVWLTGFASSALRAFVMLFLIWLAGFCRRRPQALSALLVSIVFAFTIAPEALLSAGFQLSHAVVAGFIFMGAPLGRLFRTTQLSSAFLQKILNSLSSALCLSLSATLFSAPFLIMHFQKMSFMGIFTNLLAVPLGSLALVFAWGATLTSCLGLAPLFNTSACALLWCLDSFLGLTEPLTQALSLSLDIPASWCLALWFCLLAVVVGVGCLRRQGTCPLTRK